MASHCPDAGHLGTEERLDIPRRPESTWGVDGILGNRIRRLSDRRVSAQRRTSWTPTLTGARSHRRGCSQLPDGQEPLPGHRWAEAAVSGPRRAVVGGCWTQQSPPPRPSPAPASPWQSLPGGGGEKSGGLQRPLPADLRCASGRSPEPVVLAGRHRAGRAGHRQTLPQAAAGGVSSE